MRGCPHGGEATEGVQCEMHKAEQLILLDGECGGRVLQGWQMDRGSCRKVNGVEHKGREG